MCGILGGFWQKAPLNVNEILKDAVKKINHRGPDDKGSYSGEVATGFLNLSHARLSIIDLSQAGHQPMHSHNGRYTIIFNGEIYNYKELREELVKLGKSFVSDSDTEVLLVAWEVWGNACLPKLIGMFAFVIFDHESASLSCARDAFGIKPFYYCYDKTHQHFIFASEIPALMKLMGGKQKLNLQKTYEYLVHEIQDSTQGSLIDNVFNLEPAHILTFDIKSFSIKEKLKWWSPSIEQTTRQSFSEAAERLREIFLTNMRLHLRSDVPVGAALSGGLDSSAIVCAMRYLEPEMPINTFSFIADGGSISEESWVDLVNNYTGARVNKIHIGENDFANDIFDLIETQGEPFVSTSVYAQYRVFKKAREKGVTVVLEGQGADELLGGYYGYPGQRMRSLLESFKVNELVQFANAWKNSSLGDKKSPWKSLIGQLLPEILHSKFLKYSNNGDAGLLLNLNVLKENGVHLITPWMRRTSSGKRRRVMEILLNSISDYELQSLLRYGDRNSMHFSVENRVPFLTTQMADFCFSLPEEYLISKNAVTKNIFKTAMRGIVPDPIIDRRDKIGFVTPMTQWMTPIHEKLRNIIQSSEIPFLHVGNILSEFDKTINSQKPLKPQVWRVINFVIWVNVFNVREN